MEIDITALVTDAELPSLSGSVAELGANAGKITWSNSMAEAASKPLLTEDQLDAARDWAREFGAWDDEHIDGWSAQEVNALVIQYVAGNLREIEALCSDDKGEIDWVKAEEMAARGTISGNVFPGSDGRFYFSMD